MNIEITYDTW